MHQYLGRSYEVKRMYPEAFQEYQLQGEFEGATKAELLELKEVYEKSGMRGYWQEELKGALEQSKHRYIPAVFIAEDYVRLGSKEKAFEFLEKAYRERDHGMAFINVEPMMASLHPDARFQDILRRMKLPQ